MLANALTPGAVSTIGGTGSTLKKFQSNVTYPTGSKAGQVVPFFGTVTDLTMPLPGNGKLSQIRWGVIASGTLFIHGTTPTINFSLIGSLGNTPSTDVVLATLTAAQSLTTNASYEFSLEAKFIGAQAAPTVGAAGGDGKVQLINADWFAGSTDTLNSGMTLLPLTGVDFFGRYNPDYPVGANNGVLFPPFLLKLGLTFAVSDSANLATLNEFYAYQEF